MCNFIKILVLNVLIMATIITPMQRYYIGDLNKAELLNAFYIAAEPVGKGFLQYIEDDYLTQKEANEILKQDGYIDYLRGRLVKVGFGQDYLFSYSHDKYYGEGSAKRIIDIFRQKTKGTFDGEYNQERAAINTIKYWDRMVGGASDSNDSGKDSEGNRNKVFCVAAGCVGGAVLVGIVYYFLYKK